MPDERRDDRSPAVPVALEFPPPLAPLVGPGGPLREAVRDEFARGLAELLDTLGIPGRPEVSVGAVEAAAARPGRWLCVRVYGRACRYPAELLDRVHSYVTGNLPDPAADPGALLEWLRAAGDRDDVLEFLRLACLEVVKRQPAALLGPAQAAAYRDQLPWPAQVSTPPSAEWLLPVLCEVLNLRLSIADRRTLSEVLAAGAASGRARYDLVEDLISALSPSVVEIHLPPDGLRQLTVGTGKDEPRPFGQMRDRLFYELGLRYPDFKVVTVPGLKPGSFAFRINHLPTLPWVGLPSGHCLVGDSPGGLRRRGIEVSAATVNPETRTEAGVIAATSVPLAQAEGLTVMSPLGYLVGCFGTVLKRHAASFLNHQLVHDHLERLQQQVPVLVSAVKDKIPLSRLMRVLRALVAEEVSIRNLRLILEKVLDYDYVLADDLAQIVFDERLTAPTVPDAAWLDDPANLAAFVRTGLKHYLSHKHTKGQNALLVNLLDLKLEQALAAHQKGEVPLDERQRDRILDGVRAEQGDRYQLASPPALLTTASARTALREVVALEFPHVPVLAYQELSPDLNIQPLARIRLTD